MWEKKIKKTIFTLAINNWEPDICDLTFPLMRLYADKIGADFYVIKERRFEDWPITYEKMQIYQLAQEMENDWNIYIDADTLVHPEMIDITTLLSKDTVLHNGFDMAQIRWKFDRFFLRDGRRISSCNWFTMASDWCIELWKPHDDLTADECMARSFPTVEETNTTVNSYHLIDDYTLSRNIAKYGLKFKAFRDLLPEIGLADSWLLWHQYTLTPEKKLEEMKSILEQWKLK
jgi:hypothetical protein